MERVEHESVIIQDLTGFYERDELNLAPWYQRRSVWTQAQKAYLINTILEDKPVPSIYIRHTIDLETERSIKEVVDGQQRLRCVMDYTGDRFAARHPSHETPVKYSELKKSERVHFLQTALSVGYLIGASDADVIEIFARINSVAKTLNPQEKRNAQFSGAFKQFCVSEAVERLPFWRDNAVFTDNAISRMDEVQFVSDLVMNMDRGLQDFSANRLTAFYKLHEDSFPSGPSIKHRLERVFTNLLSLPAPVVKRTVFARPQVLFSLLLVLDGQPRFSKAKTLDCITDIDSRVEAVRTKEYLDALPSDVYVAFTGGNMHRIRSRRVRRDHIASYLA